METALPKASPAAIAAAISQADTLFRQRADISKLRDAIGLLGGFRDPDHRNFEIEWKFARYNYFLGIATKDEKEAGNAFGKGRDAGKIASAIEPSKPDGHFWYAANLGEISRSNPITVGLKSVDDIKNLMNKVIEIQPTYQNSSAYDALAQIEMKTRIYGGSTDKAIEILETALKSDKSNADMRLHLAEAYLGAKKIVEARHQLDMILQMTPDPDFAVEHNKTVEEAKKMIKTKF